jgi:FkbM family methyltransferase
MHSLDGEAPHFEKVNALTLEMFLRQNAISRVDLLKMDIEGSEIDVFEGATDEDLQRVDQFTIEFHSRIYPDIGLGFLQSRSE